MKEQEADIMEALYPKRTVVVNGTICQVRSGHELPEPMPVDWQKGKAASSWSKIVWRAAKRVVRVEE